MIARHQEQISEKARQMWDENEVARPASAGFPVAVTSCSQKGHSEVDSGECVTSACRKAVRVRGAAALWKGVPLTDRLRVVERFRRALADSPWTMLGMSVPNEPLARHEWLVAQVGPLLDACRFLERSADKILSSRPLGGRWGYWSWLTVKGHVSREPWGTVLILAPSNYPLYLPCVQVLQALVAGNTVLWKPAPGDDELAECVRQRLMESGLPPEALRILPSPISSLQEVLIAGVDRVVLTGGVETGRKVLHALADSLVPATLELSGVDGCLVLDSESVDQAARAAAFAIHLNGGQTCMAPRRIWLPRGCTARFVQTFQKEWNLRGPMVRSVSLGDNIVQSLHRAQKEGAVLVQGSPEGTSDGGPWILTHVTPSMPLLHDHWFAPLVCVGEWESEDQGVMAMNASPFALAASIFARDKDRAGLLSTRIRAGLVVINDLVAPSAHPHVPFGGTGSSGFGTTRGPEGLLEMTRPLAVLHQRLSSPPHHEPPRQGDTELLQSWLAMIHGSSWSKRLAALASLVRLGRRRAQAALLRKEEPGNLPSSASGSMPKQNSL